MIGSRLTAQAERAAQRYQVLLTGFDAVRRQALSADSGLPKTQRRVLNSVYNLADAYLTEEAVHVQSVLALVRDDAHASTYASISNLPTPPDDAVMKHVAAIGSDLDAALRVQLERDVAAILKGLRGASLRAALIATSRGIPRSEALKIAREQDLAPFTYQDRANRTWPAHKYVRTLWRQALVLGWNETAMLTLVAHGQTEAMIEHPDQEHEWQGQKISLDEQGVLPTWEDVRDSVFHPNSEAWLAAVTSK